MYVLYEHHIANGKARYDVLYVGNDVNDLELSGVQLDLVKAVVAMKPSRAMFM